jgi:hypothetical protein
MDNELLDDDFVPDEEEDEEEEEEEEESDDEDDVVPHDVGVLEGGVAEPLEAGKARRNASQADIVRTYKGKGYSTGVVILKELQSTVECFVGSTHDDCNVVQPD